MTRRSVGFGLFRVRSPLLSESLLFSLPPGTEMVHFPGFARARLWIHRAVIRFYRIGFPHSEIPGSKPACGSPRLIAACHVLHRFSAPRHPPSTLSSLTIKYLRRESFSSTRLSCQRSRSPRIKKPSELPLGKLSHPRLPAPDSSIPAQVGHQVGGAERARTADLRLAKPPLSQLSYSPT